jgi:hypothetical protein
MQPQLQMQPRRRWKDRRGFATVYLGVSILALVAIAALGADIGRVAFTATEVQSAADVVATTGAKQLVLESADPRADAESVLHENAIDGSAAQGSQIQAFEIGNYNGTTEVFTPGGTPTNAVRAVVQAEIDNILADLLGAPKSTVTKSATAAYGSIGSGQPTLPLAVGDCNFPTPDCMDDECLPTLVQVPSTDAQDEGDNSAWTAFFEQAGQTEINSYFPTACGGGGEVSPTIHVGDDITLNNGQLTPLLNLLDACLDAGINEFLVPIIECGIQFVQTAPVLGFATIRVTDVVSTGDPKYVQLDAIFNASAPGPPGGDGYGSGAVSLVK